MRQGVRKRVFEAHKAMSMPPSVEPRLASYLPPPRRKAASRRARGPQGEALLDTTVPEAVFRHLSGSLAPFEIVIVPGLDGSGPEHWQSQWQKLFSSYEIAVSRVRQEIWSKPHYKSWLMTLCAAVTHSKKPVLLVAHSLGCLLVAHAAQQGLLPSTVAGALLVAPADVENGPSEHLHRVAAFSPIPLSPLPFPALVVGSRNDPWLGVRRARTLARHWQASFVDAGRKGHIGNQCDLGYWIDGLLFLDRLTQTIVLRNAGQTRHPKKTLQ